MSLRFWGLFLGTTSHQGAMPFPHEMTRHSKRLTPLLSTEGSHTPFGSPIAHERMTTP